MCLQWSQVFPKHFKAANLHIPQCHKLILVSKLDDHSSNTWVSNHSTNHTFTQVDCLNAQTRLQSHKLQTFTWWKEHSGPSTKGGAHEIEFEVVASITTNESWKEKQKCPRLMFEAHPHFNFLHQKALCLLHPHLNKSHYLLHNLC